MAAFAKYDGVDGESTDASHDNWIDVLSLDWGVHKPGTGSSGQSRRRGSAIIEDLVIAIEYEKASPKILEKCLRGEILPKLEVEFTANLGGDRVTYLRYVMKNVAITSYDINASGNEDDGLPVVLISNSFEEITVTYTEFANDGTTVGNVETSHEVEREAPKKKKK
ncbi:MAG: type VI secretion system tube protein Hcp [Acidimicrobiia bacterium]|nr:type VI secretion system tube protein Hcp [Acidimicrobiia bacterium]MDX2467022.1 type VI secretion system tube protein Hcp [Acidimicrobiia bacterium]